MCVWQHDTLKTNTTIEGVADKQLRSLNKEKKKKKNKDQEKIGTDTNAQNDLENNNLDCTLKKLNIDGEEENE